MELNEFREEFLAQTHESAITFGNTDEDQFVSDALDLLEKNEEVLTPFLYSCDMRGSQNRNIGFDAYAFSEADSSIVLIISDYELENKNDNLTNTDIDALYKKMRYFIEDAYNNRIKDFCDESDDIIDIAKDFREKIGVAENTEVTAFKFYIITNKVLSTRVKSVEKENLFGRPTSIKLWTLERFFDIYKSSKSERIKVKCSDFGVDGIQCIKANVSSSNLFDSYMGVVPGLMLAKLFKQYQAPLLEGNIRCFLSAKGKINKAIKGTIVGEHPENFFTYNNGIAVVSNAVEVSEDGRYITYFDGFQIINGGQTTASLTNALIKGEAPSGNLEKIYVPMKLTVLNFDINEDDSVEEKQRKLDLYNTIVQDIAKCSNWQNPTKEADFFSNDPFHREMERLSLLRENETPIKPGALSGTYWFYERSKNRWEQNTFYMTKAKRDAWNKIHPKNQVITKEKFGMYFNTIDLMPHLVCGGGVKNMPHFAESIIARMEKNPNMVNSFFFRKYVAAKIIYDSTDKIIASADWYPVGGYKAMYVPYTISKIIASLPQGKEIDWTRIWNAQRIYESLARQIEIVAYKTYRFLNTISNGGIERSFAVKEETWKQYRLEPLVLEDDFVNELIDSEEFKDKARSEAKKKRFETEIDLEVKVNTLGSAYWESVYQDLERQKLLSAYDRDVIKSMASYLKRGVFLSGPQVRKLWKIVQKIEEKTDYIFREK